MGQDLNAYPYPMIDVDPNKCYRMRFIMMASNAENYIINMAGHDMTLIALDGVPVRPLTPALHTKNKCGTNGAPILNIPENATTIEIVLNNLSPTAHNIHMHGMLFQVVNMANFEWCNINRTSCFLMPKQLNPCPVHKRRFADNNHTSGLEDLYWGCAYDPVE